MLRVFLATLALAGFSAIAHAAPFAEPEGRYTVEIPQPWSVSEQMSRPPIFAIGRDGEAYRGSLILMVVVTPTGTLDHELDLMGQGHALTEKAERTVDGAPCLFARRMRDQNSSDLLLCSIVVPGRRPTNMRFSITSDANHAIYAEQHGVVDAMIQSVKWGAGVTAGPR